MSSQSRGKTRPKHICMWNSYSFSCLFCYLILPLFWPTDRCAPIGQRAHFPPPTVESCAVFEQVSSLPVCRTTGSCGTSAGWQGFTRACSTFIILSQLMRRRHPAKYLWHVNGTDIRPMIKKRKRVQCVRVCVSVLGWVCLQCEKASEWVHQSRNTVSALLHKKFCYSDRMRVFAGDWRIRMCSESRAE